MVVWLILCDWNTLTQLIYIWLAATCTTSVYQYKWKFSFEYFRCAYDEFKFFMKWKVQWTNEQFKITILIWKPNYK